MVRANRSRYVRLLLLAGLVGCGLSARPRTLTLTQGSQPSAREREVLESARAEQQPGPLPAGAQRCSVVVPSRVPPSRRELARLVSQSESLPWALALPVERYERVEQSDADGKRAVVELLRFQAASPARAQVELELAQALGQRIAWEHAEDGAASSCTGELACTPLRGRFLDARTVLLARGVWASPPAPLPTLPASSAATLPAASEAASASADCAGELHEQSRAFELSVRTRGAVPGELREARAMLLLEPDGIARLNHKLYQSPEAAARALRLALSGHDELPTFAGVAASSFGLQRGAAIEQRSFATYDELTLQVADGARLARSDVHARTLALPLARTDLRDSAAVKAAFDRARPALTAETPHEQLLATAELLRRARTHTPGDQGLARRQYELELGLLHDPRAALRTAEQALSLGPSDKLTWQLWLRAALAELADESRLRGELARVHGLSTERAQRMARELIEGRGPGEAAQGVADYERAEWAFMSAQRLAKEAARLRKQRLGVRLALRELPRLLTYLARAEHAGELGVHVLALGKGAEGSARAHFSARTVGAGRPGLMMTAAGSDDAELLRLGQTLTSALMEGPLELLIGLEQLGQARHATLVLSGRRQGSELILESVSAPLARLRWPAIERLLAAPLRALTFATYPPDVLVVAAADEAEALAVARAAEGEPRVRCTSEGWVVQCRGALSDSGAATRALLAVLRSQLAPEARACWLGGE